MQQGVAPCPLLHMDGEEDWLLRPVLRGLCRYESLKDGSLNLVDIALLNEALDVQAENQERLHQHFNKRH